MKKKRKLKSKTICVIILIILIIITSFSLYKVIMWRIDNRKTNEQLKKIYDDTVVEEVDYEDVENINPPEDKQDDYWYYMKMDLMNVNFNDLINKNSDTVGWIKLNGTNINYPVVHTSNNDYYLTHSFDKSYNDAGWVFMDYRNDIDDLSKNTIIYGHSRLDKTMFGSLKNITKSNWYKNKDNYIVKLSTPEYNTLWQVFSVYKIPTETYYITTSFSSDADYDKFLKTISERSIYKFNDKKVVMHAKLIKRAKR